MLNQVILVGRVTENIINKIGNDGLTKTFIKIEIKRSFKNSDTHTYDSDIVVVSLWNDIANQVSDQLKVGNLIGIKGRIQQTVIETTEGIVSVPEICGEKITFISTGN